MKKRFKGKGRVSEEIRRDTELRKWRVGQAQAKKQGKRREAFQSQWQELYDQCADSASRVRLVGLREQFDRQKHGVSEPAHVEVEVAKLMSQAGFSVAFLEESDIRTADLECYFGEERIFVEVTAIVPTPSVRRVLVPQGPDDVHLEDDMYQDVFVRRLISRMTEKARQLNRYCAPVLLAITVPFADWLEGEKSVQGKVDLQRLGGLLSTALIRIPQLSAVLVTCWNFSARPARSNVRLSNAYWVARSEEETYLPRIRMFVSNPLANYSLGENEFLALKSVL